MNEDDKDISDKLATALQEAEQKEKKEKEEAFKAIKQFTDHDENILGDINFKSILGGDILQSRFMIKQIAFFIFLAFLLIIYTGNRYASQQDALLIDSLKVRLLEENYKVLTIESDLLNASRQSEIVKRLKENGDSTLLNSTTPPFAINKEETKR